MKIQIDTDKKTVEFLTDFTLTDIKRLNGMIVDLDSWRIIPYTKTNTVYVNNYDQYKPNKPYWYQLYASTDLAERTTPAYESTLISTKNTSPTTYTGNIKADSKMSQEDFDKVLNEPKGFKVNMEIPKDLIKDSTKSLLLNIDKASQGQKDYHSALGSVYNTLYKETSEAVNGYTNKPEY